MVAPKFSQLERMLLVCKIPQLQVHEALVEMNYSLCCDPAGAEMFILIKSTMIIRHENGSGVKKVRRILPL